MKVLKIFIVISLSLLGTDLYAQDLPKFGEFVLEYEQLAGQCKYASYANMSYMVSTGRLASYVDSNFEKIIAQSNMLPYLTTDDKTALIDYYKNIGFIDGIYLNDLMFEIGFAKNTKEETCAFAGCFFYNVVYNTNRLSELERAKDVIESAIIPILQKAGTFIAKISHNYIMIGMGYLTKHPSENENGGAVYCIIPTKDILDFNSLEITSNELIQNSRIYIKDVGGIKLISL